MARKIKIEVGILNIKTHPHSPDRYAELIEAVYERRNTAKVRGDRYAMLSLLDKSTVRQGYITGLLTTFVNIELRGQWFDTSSLSEAKTSDLRQISIPEHLRPNAASFRFYFDLYEHRFYFQTYSQGKVLTPSSSLRVFAALLDDLRIRENFGDVKVSLVQSRAGLSTLFSLPVIKEIEIIIERPNADIFADDFEEKIEKHLEESHSRQVTISYKAERGSSVEPTGDIKKAGEVALDNGRVIVRGRDAGGAVTKSSADYPRLLHDKYDPDETSEEAAFRGLIPRREQ